MNALCIRANVTNGFNIKKIYVLNAHILQYSIFLWINDFKNEFDDLLTLRLLFCTYITNLFAYNFHEMVTRRYKRSLNEWKLKIHHISFTYFLLCYSQNFNSIIKRWIVLAQKAELNLCALMNNTNVFFS